MKYYLNWLAVMRVWDISFLQILNVLPKPYNLAMCPYSPYESLLNPLFRQIYVRFMPFKIVKSTTEISTGGGMVRTHSWVLNKFWRRLKNWQYCLLVIDKHIANFWELEAVQHPYHYLFDCWLDLFHSIVPLFSWVNSARLCNHPKNIVLLNQKLTRMIKVSYLARTQFVCYEICTFFLLFICNFVLMKKMKECISHISDHVCRIYSRIFAKSSIPIFWPVISIAILAKFIQLFP